MRTARPIKEYNLEKRQNFQKMWNFMYINAAMNGIAEKIEK